MPRRLCFDSAIGGVRTLFWLLSRSVTDHSAKNLRCFADGASGVDWGEAICAAMIPQGHHLGGHRPCTECPNHSVFATFHICFGGGHCCADCLPPVHVGSPICKASQIFAEWLHQTGQQPKQSPDHPNCRVETESPGHPTKWSAERVAEWLPPRVQIKLDLPSLRLRPTQTS